MPVADAISWGAAETHLEHLHHPGAPVHGHGGRLQPLHWIASAWHSRHAGWRRLARMPIVASPSTRIWRERGSVLRVGGKLLLGYQHVNLGHDRFRALPPRSTWGRTPRSK